MLIEITTDANGVYQDRRIDLSHTLWAVCLSGILDLLLRELASIMHTTSVTLLRLGEPYSIVRRSD